ncbi:thioesterase II family protein [Nocardia sp. CA-128927]|uniref:thioesterase II family protein n=1 Tax=Nocardia sp. CA-128927 TaxID=3239975 RepID=UPI003D972B90
MARELGWLRQFQTPRSAASAPLLIFPHAGAGASAYRVFAKQLSDAFDVVVFQYPGRQDRAREAPETSLHGIAQGAFEAFRSSSHDQAQPLTVFGHSMGAITAFEFVRLAEAAGRQVRLLGVSAAVAPSRVADLPPHPTEDEQLLDHMSALSGTGSDVMASRDVMRMALPVMKADYRAFDGYSCAADIEIGAPIQVLGGDDDPFVAPRDLYAWSAHTRADIEVTMFTGGHFYLNDHIDSIAELLVPEASTVA